MHLKTFEHPRIPFVSENLAPSIVYTNIRKQFANSLGYACCIHKYSQLAKLWKSVALADIW